MLLYGIGLLIVSFNMCACGESEKITKYKFLDNLKSGGTIGSRIGALPTSYLLFKWVGSKPNSGLGNNVFLPLINSLGSIVGTTLIKTRYPKKGVRNSLFAGIGGNMGTSTTNASLSVFILPYSVEDDVE